MRRTFDARRLNSLPVRDSRQTRSSRRDSTKRHPSFSEIRCLETRTPSQSTPTVPLNVTLPTATTCTKQEPISDENAHSVLVGVETVLTSPEVTCDWIEYAVQLEVQATLVPFTHNSQTLANHLPFHPKQKSFPPCRRQVLTEVPSHQQVRQEGQAGLAVHQTLFLRLSKHIVQNV